MTLAEQQRVAERDRRIENLIAYCKSKYGKSYTPEVFNIYYAGYELCRRRAMQGKQL